MYEKIETSEGTLHRFIDEDGSKSVMIERDGELVPYDSFLKKPTKSTLPASVRAEDVVTFEEKEVIEPIEFVEVTELEPEPVRITTPTPEPEPEPPVPEPNTHFVLRVPKLPVKPLVTGFVGGLGAIGLTALIQHLT